MTTLEEKPGTGRELIFPVSRFSVILAFLAFAVMDFFLLGYKFPLLALALFGLGLIALALMLWPGRVCLKLDESGFEIRGPLGKERVRWQDVERFYDHTARGVSLVGMAYREGYVARQRWWKPFAVAANRADRSLPDALYAASREEILAALEQWHARYGGAGGER